HAPADRRGTRLQAGDRRHVQGPQHSGDADSAEHRPHLEAQRHHAQPGPCDDQNSAADPGWAVARRLHARARTTHRRRMPGALACRATKGRRVNRKLWLIAPWAAFALLALGWIAYWNM